MKIYVLTDSRAWWEKVLDYVLPGRFGLPPQEYAEFVRESIRVSSKGFPGDVKLGLHPVTEDREGLIVLKPGIALKCLQDSRS